MALQASARCSPSTTTTCNTPTNAPPTASHATDAPNGPQKRACDVDKRVCGRMRRVCGRMRRGCDCSVNKHALCTPVCRTQPETKGARGYLRRQARSALAASVLALQFAVCSTASSSREHALQLQNSRRD
eukprot:3138460-Rhodomonas_salina.1